MRQPEKLLCGHAPHLIKITKNKAECSVCGSYWDLDYYGKTFDYTGAYPELRHHFNESVGEMKVKTLRTWLKKLKTDIADLTVCEVGFGGGYCLDFLNKNAKTTYGIEIISANIEHAKELGVKPEHLFHFEHLPEGLPQQVDLWIFQDSFEHILEPEIFVNWVAKNTSQNGQILLVAPKADSLSNKVFGKFWIHKLEDHKFHWSQPGLVEFMQEHGFDLESSFFPVKYISPKMSVAHIFNLMRIRKTPMEFWPDALDVRFPFNFGEMGLVLKRKQAAATPPTTTSSS